MQTLEGVHHLRVAAKLSALEEVYPTCCREVTRVFEFLPVASRFDTSACPTLYSEDRLRMSKTNLDTLGRSDDRDLYSGLIRLHVLHHAAEEPIWGMGMIEELARHGYRISPGSLYPLLHGLEKKGYLKATEIRNGKSLRKVYRATPLGRKALAAAKGKVRELFRELMEGR